MTLRLGFLFITVGLFFKVSTAESELFCPELNGFFADAIDCTIFYRCVSNRPYKFSCSPGTFFDPIDKICNWPRKVTDCNAQGKRVYYKHNNNEPDYGEYEYEQIITDTELGPPKIPKPEPEYPKYPDTQYRPDVTDEDSFVCPASEGFFPHPRDCKRFFRCVSNKPVPFDCAPGTFFDQTISVCNFPEKVSECDDNGNRIFDGAGYYPDYFEPKESGKYPSSSNTDIDESDGAAGYYPDYFESKEKSKYPTSSNTDIHETDEDRYYPDYYEPKGRGKYPTSSNTGIRETDEDGYYPNYFERKESGKYPVSSNTDRHKTEEDRYYPDYYEPKGRGKYPTSSNTGIRETEEDRYYPDYYEPKGRGKYPTSSNTGIRETDEDGYYPNYFERKESGKYPVSSNTDRHKTDEAGRYSKESGKYPASSHTKMHEKDEDGYYPNYFERKESGKYPVSSNTDTHKTDGTGHYPDYFEPIENDKYPASSNNDMYATGFIPCLYEYSLHPYPKSCSKFIYCYQYQGLLFECPRGLNFDRRRLICDFPKNAPC